MKKLVVIFLVVIAISCVDENHVESSQTPLAKFLSSESFKELKISPSMLDHSRFAISRTESGREVLTIPYIDDGKKSVIIAFVTGDGNYAANVGSIISEHASFNGVSEAINEGKFSGAFTLSSSIGAVSFRVEASKLVDTEVKTSSRGRSAECYTARDVLACAGRSINRMGPFSYTACLIDMPICVLIEMADCAYGGCQW